MCRTDFDVISFRGFRPTAKLGLAQIESSECSRRQVSTTFDRCLPVSRFAETLRSDRYYLDRYYLDWYCLDLWDGRTALSRLEVFP